jgi:hypothetical protein
MQPFQRRQSQPLGGTFSQLTSNAFVRVNTQGANGSMVTRGIGIMVSTDTLSQHLLHEFIVVIRSHDEPSSQQPGTSALQLPIVTAAATKLNAFTESASHLWLDKASAGV